MKTYRSAISFSSDPVVTPVWTAPRPVPTFESVSWNCPAGSSLFLCVGTLTVENFGGEALVKRMSCVEELCGRCDALARC